MPGEKYFLWNAMPNLILILYLLYYLSIRKGAGSVIAALFVYLSLHGGYAIFAAATGDGINTLNTLHYQSSDLGAKLAGLFFMTFCGIILVNRLHNPLQVLHGHSRLVLKIGYLLIVFLFVMALGAANLPNTSSSKLLTISKETLFAVWMWVGAIIFAVVLKQGGKYFITYRGEWLIILAGLSVVMVLIGLYEITTGVVWAGTSYANGFSYRASGALFNPNVLGFWCALMTALISFMFHLKWMSRVATFGVNLVLIFALILSSSRSGLMLSLINLTAISLFFIGNNIYIRLSLSDKLWPLISFVLAFVICAIFIEYFNSSRFAFANTLYANMQRFLQLPLDIFWIFMIKIIFPVGDQLSLFLPSGFDQMTKGMRVFGAEHISGHMSESVNGRTLLESTSDNSFVSIYAIGGLAALLIWFCLWAILLWLGLAKNRRVRGINSSYALVGLIFCFTSGLFLRTPHLFPSCIFLSMVLGACLCWWLLADIDDNLNPRQVLGGAKAALI